LQDLQIRLPPDIKVMAADDTPPTEVSWNQKFTDFTVALKSGKKVKVHRHVLAKDAEVFDAMLTQDTQEKNTKEMSLEHWDESTAISFLEYLYSGSVNDSKTTEELREAVGPNQYIYRRSFEREKLTVGLLKMADMYEVEDLKIDCTEYLTKNLNDDNVMEVWMGTQSLDNKSLHAAIVKHLAERPIGKTLKDIPGFNEAFQSQNNPLKDLVEVLSDQVSEQVSTMKCHKQDCENCLIHCPKLSCKRKLSVAKMLDHLKIDHKKEDFDGRGSCPELNDSWIVKDTSFHKETIWKPSYINFRDQHFYLECWRNTGGIWCMWVYMLGIQQKCEEYRFTIKVKRENIVLTYQGPCIPMDHSKEKVAELGKGLIFTDAVARQSRDGERLHYHLVIETMT